ncbi:helix-turn-helix transcriptional regulator [Lentibacillus sp.]|uniref:helix-turn-helix domain-containing protein n=1 Tax=Lentibacillus sp. TaxID=1925746 RepID=UPI002B4B2D3A|nr:helix-turn-helix transcriptional regulator [Lentibacillus sp.]HLS10433.1 helix-turn-helix transcriptional regulator [Lentibacillus sp.]
MAVDNKNEVFGTRMKELRKKRNISQEHAAQALGISRARYSHYENNYVEPDIELIRKIADFYNVKVDYLLGRTDIADDDDEAQLQDLLNNPETELMFNDWKNMSEEERKEAINMIKYIKFKNKEDD